ncbi:MAG TPA: hypothetical protein PK537_11135 [Candidatus Limiplasma sp.]|nr:hypothetical protein [Candidatus Limiplasma sp.]
MVFKAIRRSIAGRRVRHRAIRTASALPADQQSLAAVYALGIRDGLQIAADIRQKINRKGDA